MAPDINRDPDLEWLEHVQPVGLVVASSLLKELGLSPIRQSPIDTGAVDEILEADLSKPALHDAWLFVERVLGWEARHVAGATGGPSMPDELLVALPEHGTTLKPTWAVAQLGSGNQRWQLLVRTEAVGIEPDARGALDGWEATPHQRFERLLRDTGVFAGLMITDKVLRLIYAPRGETSGHLTFPIRPLGTVAGRPMLGGLKLLLDAFRLFSDADDRRLPSLLKKSRDAQASVSAALAEQVLGALHEFLRGLDSAEPALIRSLATSRPGHLYEGLLAVLMRLVFVLYAEDRDLLPSRSDGRAREIYETSYSVAWPLRQARRGRRAQSRHDGRTPWRLGPPVGVVQADLQGACDRLRTGARRQAVRSGRISFSRRASDEGRAGSHPHRLRRLPVAHPRRPDDPEAYQTFRANLMIERSEGLTKIYNRFHARAENAPIIAGLRSLHAEMDVSVLRAYGWDDLAERAAPEFVEQDTDEGKTPKTRLDWPAEFKDEVLTRLLALNAERAAAERAAGLTAVRDDGGDIDDEGEAAQGRA